MRTTANRTTRVAATLVGVALAATGLVVAGAGSASASVGGMFSQVNASRSANGLKAYTWDSHLASVAAGQARRMADQKKLYHNPNLASEVGSFRWVGENVGYGPTSDVIENAFMNSAPHRANILDSDYTQIGIAAVQDSNGRLWVAQVFREPIGSTTTVHKTAPKKPKAAPQRTNRSAHATTTTTHRSNATVATKRTVTRPAAAKHVVRKKATVRKAPRPTPEPTLAQRVSYATAQQSTTASTDPIADTLAFAATMNAVAG